jgi:hypothetical protein
MSGPDPCASSHRPKLLCTEGTAGYRAVRRSQTPAEQIKGALRHARQIASEGALHAAKAAIEHVAIEKVVGAVVGRGAGPAAGHAAGAITAYGALGYEGTQILYDAVIKRSMREGKDLAAALARDNRDVAMLCVVNLIEPGAVPQAYFIARAREVGADRYGAHVSTSAASDLVARASKGEPDAMQLRDRIVRGFKDGMFEAHRSGIASRDALREALLNGSVRERYQVDPAFHQGVEAAIAQALVEPDAWRKQVDQARKTAAEADRLRDMARTISVA